jgi:site-specific DNA-cytosine methylase
MKQLRVLDLFAGAGGISDSIGQDFKPLSRSTTAASRSKPSKEISANRARPRYCGTLPLSGRARERTRRLWCSTLLRLGPHPRRREGTRARLSRDRTRPTVLPHGRPVGGRGRGTSGNRRHGVGARSGACPPSHTASRPEHRSARVYRQRLEPSREPIRTCRRPHSRASARVSRRATKQK